MDKKIENMIRPRWIQLLKIQQVSDIDKIARRFFGRLDGVWANHTAFVKKLGVDLKPFTGYYMEIGGTAAPIAPITAGVISPILALRMTQRGRYKPMRLSLEGLYSQDKAHAWLEVDAWEKLLGDDLFQRLQEKAEQIDKRRNS